MASELGLSVDLSVDKTDSGAFKELVRAKLTCGGTIFAAWVHADIPDLIEELDVPNHRSFRNWPTTCASDTWAEPEYVGENDPGDECYDQLWVVEFTKGTSDSWLASRSPGIPKSGPAMRVHALLSRVTARLLPAPPE
jgi:hypothetical protein